MNMGIVIAIFGILLVLGVALPGVLLTWKLLFPRAVERAYQRLLHTPWQCFWFGLGWLTLATTLIVILFTLPFPLSRLLGWIATSMLLACTSVGAAGVAALMGNRLRDTSGGSSQMGAFLRGAVAFELAIIFPLIGWFVVLPIATVCALGAAGFALLRWRPRPVVLPTQPEVAQSNSLT